ncbi:MAG: hypothetical protein ACLQBQ_12300 [Smithella sp.]
MKLKYYTQEGVFTSAPSVGSFNTNYGITVTFNLVSNAPCSSAPYSGFPYALNPANLVSSGKELYFGYVYNSPQAISPRGDLILNDPNQTAGIYPPANGTINITTQVGRTGGIYTYTYQSRIPQIINPSSPPASFTLHNIQPPSGVPYQSSPIVITYNSACLYDVNQTTQIYLGKTLGIQSISTY